MKKAVTLFTAAVLLRLVGVLSTAVVFADGGNNGKIKGIITERATSEEVKSSTVTARISNDGIQFKGHTKVTPGHHFTIWAILFDDDGNATTEDKLTVWGTGGVANQSGTLEFDIFVPVGAVPAKNGATIRARPDDASFDDPQAATGLKLTFRDHGPEQPFMQGAQVGTHAGGCAGRPVADGPPGPFVCVDIQDATFPGS